MSTGFCCSSTSLHGLPTQTSGPHSSVARPPTGTGHSGPHPDQPGREAAATVLHERVAERVADARRNLDAYRALLDNPAASETGMQDFLAPHSLLFGLELRQHPTAAVRPSGSMDFLLERYDGYIDVVELKGPHEPILRSREQILTFRTSR